MQVANKSIKWSRGDTIKMLIIIKWKLFTLIHKFIQHLTENGWHIYSFLPENSLYMVDRASHCHPSILCTWLTEHHIVTQLISVHGWLTIYRWYFFLKFEHFAWISYATLFEIRRYQYCRKACIICRNLPLKGFSGMWGADYILR
jgi:hypothetical protein